MGKTIEQLRNKLREIVNDKLRRVKLIEQAIEGLQLAEQIVSEEETRKLIDGALMLACKRIADSQQGYEEADTAEGWREKFIEQARGQTVEAV